MTKRTLIIIITILAVIDIAAGFWYLAGHVNSDGKGGDLLEGERQVEAADTMPERNIPDEFRIVERQGYFVSKKPSKPGYYRTYWSSIKRFKGRIPTSINGSPAIDGLIAEISHKAFGFNDPSWESLVNAFVQEPVFNSKDKMDYMKLGQKPYIEQHYGNVQGIKVYPTFGSSRLLVMVIDHSSFNGDSFSETMQFVTFDRMRLQVISNEEILNLKENGAILSLINSNINQLNSKGRELYHATQLPAEINVRRGGIFFIFPAGTIAPVGKGMQDIFISYGKLKPHLTKEFQDIIAHDSNFRRYKPLSFK